MPTGDDLQDPIAAGQCLCGSVRYQVSGSLGEVRYCHCSRCRTATGSAFSANAKIPVARFALLAGEELLREYEDPVGTFRVFCSVCGSPLFARINREPEHVRVRLGGLSGQLDVRITAHVWVSSKSTWYSIADGLPQHLQSAV